MGLARDERIPIDVFHLRLRQTEAIGNVGGKRSIGSHLGLNHRIAIPPHRGRQVYLDGDLPGNCRMNFKRGLIASNRAMADSIGRAEMPPKAPVATSSRPRPAARNFLLMLQNPLRPLAFC